MCGVFFNFCLNTRGWDTYSWLGHSRHNCCTEMEQASKTYLVDVDKQKEPCFGGKKLPQGGFI